MGIKIPDNISAITPYHAGKPLDELDREYGNYIDFADKQQRVDICSLIRNIAGRCPVMFFRAFSKLYGLAGFDDRLRAQDQRDWFLPLKI